MSKKPLPSDLEQFVTSFSALFAFTLLFLLALVAATYVGGVELAEFIENLPKKMENP